jgi:chromosome partitioning protein
VAVLNFVKPRVNINAVKRFLLEAGELCPVEVADRTDYARAGAKGLGLVDVAGHQGAEEMRAVWQFVRGKLGLRAAPAKKKEARRVQAA